MKCIYSTFLPPNSTNGESVLRKRRGISISPACPPSASILTDNTQLTTDAHVSDPLPQNTCVVTNTEPTTNRNFFACVDPDLLIQGRQDEVDTTCIIPDLPRNWPHDLHRSMYRRRIKISSARQRHCNAPSMVPVRHM